MSLKSVVLHIYSNIYAIQIGMKSVAIGAITNLKAIFVTSTTNNRYLIDSQMKCYEKLNRHCA